MGATKDKPAKKSEPKADAKPKAARKSQALTLTQATQIEAQFDTFASKGQQLAQKLVDIEARFPKKDSFVPQKVAEAREKLVEALATIDESKELFAEVGAQYREFFG
jgi:hypothetical protein